MSDNWKHISNPVGWVIDKTRDKGIAAIPTRYSGVQFRSRLEARWAAFFDLRGWEWRYEPLDLNGWTPDFLIRPVLGRRPSLDLGYLPEGAANVYAEVKPVMHPGPNEDAYRKAVSYGKERWVLLLGVAPAPFDFSIGYLMDTPENSIEPFSYLDAVLGGYVPDKQTWTDLEPLWREAGNRVQWRAPEVNQ